ncbi:neuronal acetylcholine receptor subunit alpha-10-like [Lineus longissimus]|uniref:neuronal acetylcholine receptor subunit alpha-10-like n=1 Tax=Lineus longissimus TaxID=88925 RepID=UPI002B4EA2A9
MTYFPFDRHRCKLTFSFWLHNAQLIRAKTMTEEAITALYVPNGQWELEQTEVTDRIISTIGNESDPTTMVSHLFVHIQMRRKPGFYIMNVILPCISISFLVLTLFYLPCDSGEKVSLGITVLLAFSVFQLAVADTMPRAFHSTPVILIYLSTLMGMATISTAQAVFVLNIHHMDGDTAMPTWFRRFVFCYLTKMICRRRDFSDFMPENVVHCEQDGINRTDYHNCILHKTRENGGIYEIAEERSGKLDGIFRVLELMYKDMCKFYKRIEERDSSERMRREWKAAAKVIDRCFILVYFFVSTAFTFSCLVIAPSIGAYEVPNMLRDKPW